MAPTRRPLGPESSVADSTMVAMFDGVRLATDVYLPSGPGPFPTVLRRLPYGKNDIQNLIELTARCMNERGYAFVAQDTRGKARSEGEFWPFSHERRDGYDTLEWLAAQSWCDGRLAMNGASYNGFTQWAAVASGHPNLRAILPVGTTSFVGRDWLWRQGVFELGFAAQWSAITWVDAYLYSDELALDWSVRPLQDVLAVAFGGKQVGPFQHMAHTAEHDPYWTDEIYGGLLPSQATAVAALHSGGWWDRFSRGQIADWALASRTSTAPQILAMDAVDHYGGEWTLEPTGIPKIESFAEADLAAFVGASTAASLDFLDAVVLGRSPEVGPPVRWHLARMRTGALTTAGLQLAASRSCCTSPEAAAAPRVVGCSPGLIEPLAGRAGRTTRQIWCLLPELSTAWPSSSSRLTIAWSSRARTSSRLRRTPSLQILTSRALSSYNCKSARLHPRCT